MSLQVALLFPCHGMETRQDCSLWIADEWHGPDRATAYKDKRNAVHEFSSVEEAEAHYRPLLPRWITAEEDRETCTFSVTGSHTICEACQAERAHQRQQDEIRARRLKEALGGTNHQLTGEKKVVAGREFAQVSWQHEKPNWKGEYPIIHSWLPIEYTQL